MFCFLVQLEITAIPALLRLKVSVIQYFRAVLAFFKKPIMAGGMVFLIGAAVIIY
jgi:hypothetical protein